MDIVETFMVDDFVKYAPPDERIQRRDAMRAELLRYTDTSTGSYDQGRDNYTSGPYIEPTSDGYPGLEAPLG